jgi:hypothetical protein
MWFKIWRGRRRYAFVRAARPLYLARLLKQSRLGGFGGTRSGDLRCRPRGSFMRRDPLENSHSREAVSSGEVLTH